MDHLEAVTAGFEAGWGELRGREFRLQRCGLVRGKGEVLRGWRSLVWGFVWFQ